MKKRSVLSYVSSGMLIGGLLASTLYTFINIRIYEAFIENPKITYLPNEHPYVVLAAGAIVGGLIGRLAAFENSDDENLESK